MNKENKKTIMETFDGGSLELFIEGTPNARFCVKNVSKVLEEAGFVYMPENEIWTMDETKKGMYTVRGDSIIAITFPNFEDAGLPIFEGFDGTITHSDSPCFKIKRSPEIVSDGYVKLNVEPYGSPIFYSWLDRPLAICGSIITTKGKKIDVNYNDRFNVFIPSQAIHINRDVNKANNLNPQKDMLPIWGFTNEGANFKQLLELEAQNSDKEMGTASVLAMDMMLYNPMKIQRLENAIVMGPRLDNLASVYVAVKSFVDTSENILLDDAKPIKKKNKANVLAIFNSEEIGSQTRDGADSDFLTSTLERFCDMYLADVKVAFANSNFLSIDAAHAVHPNAPEKSDPTNKIFLGKGVAIKHHDNYASCLELEAALVAKCGKFQHFHSRSDMRCGSTLGNISLSHNGIKTIDIGIPMLAMHSSVETISSLDLDALEDVLLTFYGYEVKV